MKKILAIFFVSLVFLPSMAFAFSISESLSDSLNYSIQPIQAIGFIAAEEKKPSLEKLQDFLKGIAALNPAEITMGFGNELLRRDFIVLKTAPLLNNVEIFEISPNQSNGETSNRLKLNGEISEYFDAKIAQSKTALNPIDLKSLNALLDSIVKCLCI